MRGEGDQQQEIVLGNKQLLSVFFVVVAMMGVAFTIGYIIGRNTANAKVDPVTAAAARSSTPPSPAPDTYQNPRESPQESAPAPEAAAATPAAGSGTQPARPYDEPAAGRKASAPQEKTKTAKPEKSAPEADAAPSPVAVTAGATYLQVAALKRPDADHVMKVLRGHGFPALLGESPKEGLFRVLVGPFKDMPAVAESKQKLRAAGFEAIVAR